MIRRSPRKPALIPIHSRLEPGEHDRLQVLADRQNSSVARIVKLAVIEYLDRHARDQMSTADKPHRTIRQD